MPIEGLDSREQLMVVPDVDENLRVVLDTLQWVYSKKTVARVRTFQIDLSATQKPSSYNQYSSSRLEKHFYSLTNSGPPRMDKRGSTARTALGPAKLAVVHARR